MSERIIATLEVYDFDVANALAGRIKPKNWNGFIQFLEKRLLPALVMDVSEEIRYFANLYLDKEEGDEA
ncbi:MAG: hypothetical protein ACOYYF_12730 [Chloroflexota bacterium]